MRRDGFVIGVLLVVLMSSGGCRRDETSTGAQAGGSQAPEISSRGIGPVTKVELGPLDPTMAEKGRAIFEQKCAACHHLDERFVGPAIRGVTKRRTPEWIMNMILNPV